MSLESFIGAEQSEGMSSASLEQLREKMKRASAQIAAIKKEEKKRKKKEDELLKILLKFIQSSHKTDLVLLISRVLEQNIPANFVLAVVLLGNEEIQAELGNFLLSENTKALLLNARIGEDESMNEEIDANKNALVFFDAEDKTMPLRVKIEVDNWIKNILAQANEAPHKLLRTVYQVHKVKNEDGEKEEVKELSNALVLLTTHVLRSYLEQKSLEEPHEKIKNFCHFIIKGIVTKAKEGLDNRAQLN